MDYTTHHGRSAVLSLPASKGKARLPAASRSTRKQLHPLPTSAHQAIDPHLSPYEQLLLMDEANKEMLHLNRFPILASLTDKHPTSQ
ncbi:unnamed protein product [Sphagnum troendelagicum]|uniref:Uncharacterized protein n=1 Tax=Sphagnum troendelagicum TaxID=128251 RepID=A0ABP0UD62_9BRYO